MTNPFRISGFEKKLLVFFLLLSVTPTVLIAIFGVHYFLGPVERVSSPALRESFTNSMEIARQLSVRLERDASLACSHLSEEFARSRLWTRRGAVDRLLEATTQRAHADFTALYVLEGGSWHLKTSWPSNLSRVVTTLTADDVSREPGPQKIDLDDPDIVASGALHGQDSLLVAGLMLDPGMMERMRKTGDDLSLYGSARQWVTTMRLYIIVIFTAIVVVAAISSTVVSRVLAQRISFPIRELALATARIARGDLDHRVKVKAKDEIQSLISSFNNMTEELQENKRNLIAMATREAQIARDFEIARQVQQNLFPKILPDEAGWDFAATCRPARAVGGDYYDVFEVAPGKVLFAQGDVAGKGLGASLVMASIHAIVRSWAGSLKHDLTGLIRELNTYLVTSSSPETFVTLFLGLLDCDEKHIWYVNCGHPPALVRRAPGGESEELTRGGTILGIMMDDNYETGVCAMREGDSLVLVSDGVTEATDPEDNMFEVARLVDIVRESRPDGGADRVMDSIVQAVDAFAAGREQADDISVLVITRKAAGVSGGMSAT